MRVSAMHTVPVCPGGALLPFGTAFHAFPTSVWGGASRPGQHTYPLPGCLSISHAVFKPLFPSALGGLGSPLACDKGTPCILSIGFLCSFILPAV